MPISQPNSALARAQRYLDAALDALRTNKGTAEGLLFNASAALNFAGNSQDKLIKACNKAAMRLGQVKADQFKSEIDACDEAVIHAEGPGID